MNIREEIYQYAYKEDYIDNTKDLKLGKKQSIITYIIMFTLTFFFSLPMLVTYTITWFSVTIIALLVILLNAKEKNPYLRSTMNFATVLLYFGIVIACAIIANSINRFQIDRTSEIIITSVVGLALYDIGVTIKIVRKKYSQKRETHVKTKNTQNSWNVFGPLSGCILGRLISRVFGNVPALDWLPILLCSIVLVLSLVFLQKYLICKLFCNKRINIVLSTKK